MIRPMTQTAMGLAAAFGLLAAGAALASTPDSGSAPLNPGKGGLNDVPKGAEAPPAEAQGKVVLRCKVTPERTLDQCRVASETPAGHGLGDAALGMAKDVRINAGTFKPEMVGSFIEIPIRFAQDAPSDDDTGPGLAAMPM